MNTFIGALWKIFLYTIFIIIIVLISIGGIYYILIRKSPLDIIANNYTFSIPDNKQPAYTIFPAIKREMPYSIEFTGTVLPIQKTTLGFEKIGKISLINVKEGDTVKMGDVLIRIKDDDLKAQITEAKADLSAQEAILDKILAGTRKESIAVQKQNIANLEISVIDAKIDIITAIKNSYTISDDSIYNRADNFFNNPRTREVKFYYPWHISETKPLEDSRESIETILSAWNYSLQDLAPENDLTAYISAAKDNLNIIKDFLRQLSLVINNNDFSASDTQKTSIQTARINTNNELASIALGEKKLNEATSNLASAKKQLALMEAGATKEEVDGQIAIISKYKAVINRLNIEAEKTILKSPFEDESTISWIDADIGEVITAKQPLITIIDTSRLKVEAKVSELDIANIKEKQVAEARFDAFGKTNKFNLLVDHINPEAILIDNVPTYLVTLYFEEDTKEVRPGMTANITIDILQNKSLVAPIQSINNYKGGSSSVKILKDEKIEKRSVILGDRYNDGYIEIIDGIKEGDQIIIEEIDI